MMPVIPVFPFVIPAQAGIHAFVFLVPRLRGGDMRRMWGWHMMNNRRDSFFNMVQKMRAHSDGGALIEFVLMLPIIFVFLAGILNFGSVARGYLQLNIAMNAGISYGISNPDKVNNIQSTMTNAVSTPMTITVSQFCECSNGVQLGCNVPCTDLALPGTFVSIEAQTSLTLPMYNFILSNPYIIKEKIVFRIK